MGALPVNAKAHERDLCRVCVTKDFVTLIGSRSCAANDDVFLLGFQV